MWTITISKLVSTFPFLLLSFSMGISLVTAQLRDEIDYQWNSVKMPFAVSDVMANYMQVGNDDDDEDGIVIITGGCDSVKGNERITIEIDGTNGTKELLDLFECTSVTNATLKFDPIANTFSYLADMPRERTRHAAAVVQGELYVFGGRDSMGNMVAAIDSYNPTTDTWTTRGALPDDLVTSDHTAWSWENRYIYITGGFVTNYTAVTTTFRLDMGDAASVNEKPMSFDDMHFALQSPAPSARGDIHAVELYGYAYMAGGSTHTSVWCEGLKTTERYHMASDTWESLSDLNVGRIDMAVTVLNGKIISMGGETKPDNCKTVADPAYGSFPASHVEVLIVDPTHAIGNDEKMAKWTMFEEFQDERFRFAAVVVPSQDRIYTFGGQLPFDFTCDCFPTSDDVGIGTEVFTPETTSTTDTNSASSSSLSRGAIIAVIIVGFLLFVACIYLLAKNLSAQNAGPSPKPATSAGPKTGFEPTEDRPETA